MTGHPSEVDSDAEEQEVSIIIIVRSVYVHYIITRRMLCIMGRA